MVKLDLKKTRRNSRVESSKQTASENKKKKKKRVSLFKREPRRPAPSKDKADRSVHIRTVKVSSAKNKNNGSDSSLLSDLTSPLSPSSPSLSSHKQQHQQAPQSPTSSTNMSTSGSMMSESSVAPPAPPQLQQQKESTSKPSLVSSVLNMVDRSCVTSGLLPDDSPERQRRSTTNEILQGDDPNDISFTIPEWGVPPEPRGSPHRKHETFEMVYQEPEDETAAATNRVASWLRSKRKPTTTATTTLGITPRSTAPEPSLLRSGPPKTEPFVEPAEFKRSSTATPRVFKLFGNRSHSVNQLDTASTEDSDSGEDRKQQQQAPPQHQHTTVRKVLESIKHGKLETVHEEASDDNEQLKVRVPGEPNKYITDKDLIGDEVVEEIYAALEAQDNVRRHPVRPAAAATTKRTEQQPQAPPIVLTPSRSPKRGEYHQFESDDDDDDDDDEPYGKPSDGRSWKERFGLTRTASGESEPQKSSSRKPMWKAALDSQTGRTYYYHRKTRATTWTKPADEDLILPAAAKKQAKKKKKQEAKKNDPAASKKEPLASALRNATTPFAASPRSAGTRRRSTDPPQQGNNAMGNRIGSDVSPEVLVLQNQGEELLTKLRNIVDDDKPFDEPRAEKKHDEKSVANRTQAAATIYSGFSSHKSRISESTQPITNTSSRVAALVLRNNNNSTATNESTDGPHRTRPKIPKNIPVPRLRELNVEEFSTTARDRNMTDRSRVLGPQRTTTTKENVQLGNVGTVKKEQQSPYEKNNDNDDGDKDSYAGTDSISALSEDNLSYIERRELSSSYEDARRRALQRAIAQQDWDLAAQMTESLRQNPRSRPPAQQQQQQREWQSEIDRYIARNDWKMVDSFIRNAQVKAHQTERKRMNHHLRKARPQKRFGARSQLQHRDLRVEDDDDESDDDDDDSQTASSYNSEPTGPPPPRTQARRPREFAC